MKSGAGRFLTLATQIFACVILIVAWLLPRRPTSAPGWLAYLVALTLLVAVFFGLARVLTFLEIRSRQRPAIRLLGVVLAVFPLVAVVYLLFSHATLVMRYFQ